jgi:predicted lipid-binding transport protein (Tim44 family)
VPQDVEWAVARDLPFPDSVFFLQHRPETTWTGGQDVGPAPAAGTAPAGTAGSPPDAQAAPAAAAEPAFDPVKYALRNVFKVPGA